MAPSLVRRLALATIALTGLVSCSGDGGGGNGEAALATVGAWKAMAPAPLSTRVFPATTWTGKELFVWGGRACKPGACDDEAPEPFTDGAAYDPAADSWRALPAAPLSGRSGAGALWTGTEVLIWGGNGPNKLARTDGGAYNPATGAWRPLAASPFATLTMSPVWTGKEMLAWGSTAAAPDRVDGAAYDPAADTWRPAASPPLSKRTLVFGAWTGTEAVYWGGLATDLTYLADGAVYDPSTDAWRPMAKSPLSARATRVLWTGTELLAWGGEGGGPGTLAAFADGAAYDLGADTWRKLPVAPISARRGAAIEWTGTQMVVWGGAPAEGPVFFGNGATYDPAT
ncbi:MAG: hypothetical protein ACR2MO_09375, partial [Acidimicrobiales bacterium]